MRDADAANLHAIAGELAEAVRDAGTVALKKFRAPLKSWFKDADGGRSPVSEIDIAIDDMLRARLMARAPGYGWLSEESADEPSRLTRDRVWVLDPIDGTRAFIGGRNDWCIAVALVETGRPVVAAICAPADGLEFLAVAGRGATLNGTALAAHDGDDFSGARAAGPQRLLDALARAAPGTHPLSKVHSLALRLARVASGDVDVAFAAANSHDWDIAAADLIVQEAGGCVTTQDGSVPTYNRPNPVHGALVAAGRKRHSALLRLMRERHAAFA